jgi:CubicO group peptidase (beta-lactamase class C family)
MKTPTVLVFVLLRLVLGGATIAPAAYAQPSAIQRLDGSTITPTEIDRTVQKLMQAAEVPGVAIAMFDGPRITYLKAYGVRDKDHNLPLTVDSVFSGASFTKSAFAYMVMQLAGERKLDLDKPVNDYLPKPIAAYDRYTDLAGDPRYKRITARMLLSHTAGFPNWRVFEDDRKLKIHFEPGERFAYSGEGIDLLQLVVETVTKRPLDELMQERVFGPLGMTRSSMVWQPQFESDYANGFDEYGRSLGPQKRKHADAAGSLLTTAGDFARLVQAVMLGTGLTRQAHEQMLSAQIPIVSRHEFPSLAYEPTDANKGILLSYGLGWGLYSTARYGRAFFKEGHDDAWRNYAVCFDKAQKGIVIMTNSGNGEGIYRDLLETLLRDTFTPIEWEGFTPYNQLPVRPPLPVHKQIRVDAAVLDRYAGRYGEPPQLIVTVRRDGDHLTVQENDEPAQGTFPESETQFFSKQADDVFTFEMDGKGQVVRMVLRTGGRVIPIARIGP